MSGINFIRRFVINQMTKKSDNGIMITLPDRKKVDLNTSITAERLMRNGIDPNAITSPQQVENILNQLNKPRVIPADSPEGRGITNALLRRGQVVDLQGRKIDTSKPIVGGKQMDVEPVNNKFVDYTISSMNKMEPIDAMKEANKILKREGPYKDLTTQQAKKILDDTEDHIFERNIKPKETDITLDEASSTLDQEIKNAYNKAVREGKFKGTEEDFRNKIDDMMDEDFAAGGRVGLKSGMSRRAFLQLMGGVGAGIGAAKTGILKMFGKGAGKQAAKEIISTPNVPGKPEWFDSLVNKVITQGDDVSKNFATQDRQVVHRVFLDKDGKVIDAKQADKLRQEGNVYDVEDITVTRNLDDGQIRVNYYSDKNMGAGDVELIYKPGQADEMTKGKPPDTFKAAEAEPRVTNYDGDIEYDGENIVDNLEDLYSDTNKLKQFATEKKPTMKEFVESKKKQKIVEEVNSSDTGANEYLSNKYGDPIYQEPDIDPPEFASGGRVGLFLGGGLTAGKGVVREFIKKLAKEKGMSGAQMMKVLNPKAYQKFLEDPSLYKKYNPKTGLMATDEVKKFMKETEVARGDQLERLIEMIKTRRGTNENIEEMIRNAVRETGAPREEIEPLIRSMISMKAGRTGEGIIPSNVSEEALLEMEQMLKNIRTKDRQMNAGGGLAYMLGE